MGGCISTPKTADSILINNKILKSSATKIFPTGEIYYFKHKEIEGARENLNIAGGRDKVNLFFSLKSENPENNKVLQYVQVGIFISSLKQKDIFSHIGQTESLEQSSLTFYSTFCLDYFFEVNQMLKFEIRNNGKKVEEIQTTLGRIMGSRGQTVEFILNYKFSFNNSPVQDNKFYLIVHGASVQQQVKNMIIDFNIKVSMNSSSNYFVIICNSIIDTKRGQRVYKSNEVSGKNLNFYCQNLNLNDICLGDMFKEISFIFYKLDEGIIGELNTTLDNLSMNLNKNFQIKNPNNSNIIGTCVISYEISKSMKFIEYLEKGMQISLIVGIDYTASNGNPNNKDSLHFIQGKEPNHYEQAIRSCGSIVAYYDYDQLFPVFGFGGIVKGSNQVSHCFNCNLLENPNVEGVDGIITSYRNSLSQVHLDGPTYFYPLIKNMVELVRSETQKSQSSIYYVLLILTDGQIHDMDKTRDVICEAASLPISIIIIGIGNADFSNMVELDGDTVPLTDINGKKIERDIVQFVVYKDYQSDVNKLAAEVLYEVPTQVEQYYKQYKNFRGLVE